MYSFLGTTVQTTKPSPIKPMPDATRHLISQLTTVAGSLVPYLKQTGVNDKHKQLRGAIKALKNDPENDFLFQDARQLAPKKTKYETDSD